MAFINQRVKSKEGISSDLINKLIDGVNRSQPNPGSGYTYDHGPGGWSLKVVPVKSTQSVAGISSTLPFTIFASISGGNTVITVQPGTINNILPQFMFEEFVGATSTTGYVKLYCNTNGNQITDATLAVSTTPSNPIGNAAAAAPLKLDVLLGVVIPTANAFNTVYGPVDCLPKQSFYTSVTGGVAPGNLPYVPWFSWTIAGG